jgi:inhibitor of KinA
MSGVNWRMPYRVYPCGDHAITIELGTGIDPVTNSKVISLFTRLQSLQEEGITDIIPSYHTLTAVYDPLLLKKKHSIPSVYKWVQDWLLNAAENFEQVTTLARKLRIPVYYDPSHNTDLSFIAEQHTLSVQEVIDIHSSATYRVYLVGFLPGFAYMGSVDKRIATPRKISPRTLVPAGSVGIAGEQTGIYPFDSPGGWQLLGQTPVPLFDIKNPEPCYLHAGDEVQFYPITIEEYKTIRSNGHTHS